MKAAVQQSRPAAVLIGYIWASTAGPVLRRTSAPDHPQLSGDSSMDVSLKDTLATPPEGQCAMTDANPRKEAHLMAKTVARALPI